MSKKSIVFLTTALGFMLLCNASAFALTVVHSKPKQQGVIINKPPFQVEPVLNSAITDLFMQKPMSYKKLYLIEKAHGGKHKQIVLKNIKIAKYYLNHKIRHVYPLIPVGSFHGKLKKTGAIKIVFGISGDNLGNFTETAGNIYYLERYAKLHNEKYKIKLVLYGAMARILAKQKIIKPAYLLHIPAGVKKPVVVNPLNILRLLHKWGVGIYVCYNALVYAHLVHYLIPHYVKTVPMGVLKIYQLRKEGYLYFTNP